MNILCQMHFSIAASQNAPPRTLRPLSAAPRPPPSYEQSESLGYQSPRYDGAGYQGGGYHPRGRKSVIPPIAAQNMAEPPPSISTPPPNKVKIKDKKKCIRFENTPRHILTSCISAFLLWQPNPHLLTS